MEKTSFNKANFQISKVGLGTNAVGGHNLFQNLDEEQGKALIKEALNQGINFFDTADAYGFGRSEELLGEVLKSERAQAIVATKSGIERLDDGTTRFNNRPEYLRSALEKSLKRLQREYVDIFYIHFPDGTTPLAESVGELTRLKEEGKIGSIGISNVNLEQLKEANEHNDITVVQNPYNMLERSAEKDVLPYCLKNDISLIPYGPLAFGILGGKYSADFTLDENDWRHDVPLFSNEQFSSSIAKAEKLKELAANKGITLPNLALAWLLSRDGIDAVIPGAKNPEQVKSNAEVSDIMLDDTDLEQISNILETSKVNN